MRRGEIFNLKWSNIDFEYGYIELLETKSGKSRKIPISSKLMQTLNECRNETEYVFINKETRLPYNNIKRSFNTILKKQKFMILDFTILGILPQQECLKSVLISELFKKF